MFITLNTIPNTSLDIIQREVVNANYILTVRAGQVSVDLDNVWNGKTLTLIAIQYGQLVNEFACADDPVDIMNLLLKGAAL